MRLVENDNLRSEYMALLQDIPKDIPEMSANLDRRMPDAINFWLGTSASVTSLHRDNYENFYAQVRGRKTFTLIPPAQAACVNERWLACATYVKSGNEWIIEEDEPEAKVPVAVWDPDRPMANATKFSSLCQPVTITLDEGDFLYLPACWSVAPGHRGLARVHC